MSDLILAVGGTAFFAAAVAGLKRWPDRALVPAGPTWEKIKRLLDDGYTKTQIAEWLGSRAKTPALQLRQDFITAKSASAVDRLCRKLDAGLLRRDR